MDSPILAPVAVLIAWSLLMLVWLYATRLPAMRRLRVKLDSNAAPGILSTSLPPSVRWKADNYNHLMEQPTLFYAVAFVLALSEAGSGMNVILAWFYVILRIIHSLVQAITNRIMLRFAIFILATLCLMGLSWSALKMTFHF